MWSCKPMWHCKYSVILKSKVIFDKNYMKMSKYENSMFPYSLHSTVIFPAWKPKDKCYFNVFSPSIRWYNYSQKKKFFFQNYMTNVAKIDEIREELSTFHFRRNHRNWNLPFHNFLLKYEPHIKDKENNFPPFTYTFFRIFYQKEILKKIMQHK